MDFTLDNLRISKQIANEMISESKRKNKIYSYLDTIKGAGMKHYNSSKSGAGKGWTNWVTVNDNYNQDMAKRVMEISRLGVAKDEATEPIPDIKDSNQLFQIEKLFDNIKKYMTSFIEQASGVAVYFTTREHEEAGADVGNYTEILKQSIKQLNSNNELYKIINGYNLLANYLNNIVVYKKLSQSDKNKLNDKFDELLPILEQVIFYSEKFLFSATEILKKLRAKLISRNYTPIKYNASDLADEPPKGYKPDTSGAVRRGFDIGDFEDGEEVEAVAEEKPDPFAELVEQMKISRGPISRPSRKEPFERPFSFAGEQSERLPPALPPSPRMTAEPRQLPSSSFYAGQPYERIIADAREYDNTDAPIPMDLVRAIQYYNSLGYPVEKDLYGEESGVSGKGRRKKRVVKSKNIVVDEIIPNHDTGNDIFNVLKMFSNPNISAVSLTTEKMDKRNEGLYKKKNK